MILDPQGARTSLSYGEGASDGRRDLVTSITTAAGTRIFRAGETLVGPSFRRWIEGAGPGKDRERLEVGAGYAYEIPVETMPLAPEFDPNYHPFSLRFRESYFWGTGAFDSVKPDYKKARHFRWGHGPGALSSGILLSLKEPGAPCHWFVHTGDFWNGVYHGARTVDFPLTPEGVLKPGRRLVGVKRMERTPEVLAPVFDGNRSLLTREYWTPQEGIPAAVLQDLDVAGRLVARTTSAGKATWRWDATSGDLLEVSLPGSTVQKFRYDASHRLKSWKRSPKVNLAFEYDARGRIAGWRKNDGAPWRLEYDSLGRIQTFSHSGQVWSFTWDPQDSLLGVKGPKGSAGKMAWGGGALPPSSESLGIGRPVQVPEACGAALTSLLDGLNGPLVQRLLALP